MLDAVITSTLAGTFVCVMLLIFKNKLLKLIGGRGLYYTGLCAMLIFVLPLNLPNITAVYIEPQSAPLETESRIGGTRQDYPAQAVQPEEYEGSPRPTAELEIPDAPSGENPISPREILLAVWLLGFIISVSRYFTAYFSFKRRLCCIETDEKPNGVRLVKSAVISSPMIFGFFKPTLAIPDAEMEPEDYELAIAHEMVHFKHGDSWLKLFAALVNSVCWFNPVTYFMVRLIGEACEYACDEQVTKEMDMYGKQRYSKMILSMVCRSSPVLSSNMAGSKKQLKRRFEMIMRKKKTTVLQRLLCGILMPIILCLSIAAASEAAPHVASLFKDDYVYITSFGQGDYNDFVPTEKNGTYYLPLRQFFNSCDIPNEHIKYEANGSITVDVWSKEQTVVSTLFVSDKAENIEEPKKETIIPGKFVWNTVCTVGSKDILIDGNADTLTHAPYMEDGVTYIPYEYVQKLKNHEELRRFDRFDNTTSCFTSVMLYGYDSLKSEYYCDTLELDTLQIKDDNGENGSSLFDVLGSQNGYVRLSKTGWRTEFELKTDWYNANHTEVRGNAEVKLNKVTRIFSEGSDIEGLFTVKLNGEVVMENEVGYINNLPVPAGKGIVDFETFGLSIRGVNIRVYLFGYGNSVNEAYNSLAARNKEIDGMPQTKKLNVFPSEVRLNGTEIARTDKNNIIWYNPEENYLRFRVMFDTWDETLESPGDRYNTYRISTEEMMNMEIIDENTFSGKFFFVKNHVRIDSFDGILSLMPDNTFELKSHDGAYIVRGTAADFVPTWEYTEEQKSAKSPSVKMIDE